MDRKTIGGSKVAGILGISPWATPHDVYLQMVDGVEQEETQAMEWGTRLESIVGEKYREESGFRIILSPPSVVHPTYNFLTGSPDGIVDDIQAVLEIKTARSDEDWGEAGTDQVPDYYLTQVAHYMALLDLDIAIIAVLFHGNDFRTYRVERDKELEGNITDALCKFWTDHIEAKVPPPHEQSRLRADWIKKRWPTNKDDIRGATPEEVELLTALEYFRKIGKVADLVKENLTQALQVLIGKASGLMWDGGKVTWRQSKTRVITDWKALALSFEPTAEMIQEHTTGKPGARPFIVPQKWNKEAAAFLESCGGARPVLTFDAFASMMADTLEEKEGDEHGTENHETDNGELQTD